MTEPIRVGGGYFECAYGNTHHASEVCDCNQSPPTRTAEMSENRAEVSEQCGNRFGADESCLLPNGHIGWHEGARTTWNGRNHLPLVRTGMRSHGEAEARSESRPSLSRDVDRSAASSMPSSPSSPSAPAALNPSSPERAMGDGKTETADDVLCYRCGLPIGKRGAAEAGE